MLSILIIGAGGIGGYYGARLSDAGNQVVLTARGEHLAAIKKHGLKVVCEKQTFRCAVPTVDHCELIQEYKSEDFDLIVVALKSTATEMVLNELSPWLSCSDVPVLSLQNGVDNEPVIAETLGESRVLGGLAVRIGGHIVAPGIVEAEGVAQIIMGMWPFAPEKNYALRAFVERLQASFEQAGIPTMISDNIRYELWRKLVINNGVNPISALTRLDTKSLTQHPKLRGVVYGLMAETAAAAKADGVELCKQDVDEMFELISGFNAIKTSMLIDREKGRPLELDSISGAVLRRAQALGISAPYTETISALLEQELS